MPSTGSEKSSRLADVAIEKSSRISLSLLKKNFKIKKCSSQHGLSIMVGFTVLKYYLFFLLHLLNMF